MDGLARAEMAGCEGEKRSYDFRETRSENYLEPSRWQSKGDGANEAEAGDRPSERWHRFYR